jgi:hypothetical protein
MLGAGNEPGSQSVNRTDFKVILSICLRDQVIQWKGIERGATVLKDVDSASMDNPLKRINSAYCGCRPIRRCAICSGPDIDVDLIDVDVDLIDLIDLIDQIDLIAGTSRSSSVPGG